MNWKLTVKPEVESNLDKAGITDRSERRIYLRMERKINTMQNMMANGSTPEGLYYNGIAYDLQDLIDECQKLDSWTAYCKATGYATNFDAEDCMA